jgi:hypothetical protein
MGIRTIVAALVIGSAALGCAPTRVVTSEGSGMPAAQVVAVLVQNDYMLPMNIYAVANGRTQRIGNVGPGMSGTFVLDPGIMVTGFVDIVARPSGGGRSVDTGQLNPVPGQTVDFYIGNELAASHATIR